MKTFLTVTALILFALPLFAQSSTPQAPCTAYFGVLQYDPKVPGLFVAAMSSSQAKWLAKNGQKHYPGLCLSLEKAKYLIMWSVATQVTTTEHTVQRTARADTSTTGSERGTFDTYGAISTWGRYSGSFSSDSTSTLTYDEVVPVTTATDHCSIYILKSVGATVWEDVRKKTSQPRAIFSGEALRPRPGSMESDPSGAAHIGYLFGKEPTAHALDSALKFIFEHGAQTMPVAAFMPREEKSGDQVAATIEHTQVATTAATTPAKQMAIEQMRQVAKAIKQCPPVVDRMSSPNSQCFSTEAKAGPPLNVTWDVVEKRTARAPYLGYVDFELPGTWLIDQLQPTDRKVAKACDRNYRIEAQGATFLAQAGLAAELGLPDDVEPPRSKVWHFRFEFDVGSDDPELVKMLWTDETGKAQAATAGHSCWGKAAQAVGTSSAH